MTSSKNTGRLIDLFFMTNRSLHKHMHHAQIISHFSFLQFFAMKIIMEEGPINMKDLARILSITPASTTSLADGLVKAGALERVADDSDRRVIRLRVTESGRKKLNDTDTRAKKELKKIFLELTDVDRADLIEILEKLSGILARNDKRSEPRRG